MTTLSQLQEIILEMKNKYGIRAFEILKLILDKYVPTHLPHYHHNPLFEAHDKYKIPTHLAKEIIDFLEEKKLIKKLEPYVYVKTPLGKKLIKEASKKKYGIFKE